MPMCVIMLLQLFCCIFSTTSVYSSRELYMLSLQSVNSQPIQDYFSYLWTHEYHKALTWECLDVTVCSWAALPSACWVCLLGRYSSWAPSPALSPCGSPTCQKAIILTHQLWIKQAMIAAVVSNSTHAQHVEHLAPSSNMLDMCMLHSFPGLSEAKQHTPSATGNLELINEANTFAEIQHARDAGQHFLLFINVIKVRTDWIYKTCN